jgi:hypothetical protein
MKTLCLCMILKNEGHIIERCLTSIKDIIDTYVICDTGSTDDTKEKIVNFFDKYNINGTIHDHKWVNFGVNRNMLLQAAKNKADYLLLVDADYVINIYDSNFKNNLNHDGYLLKWEGDLDYRNIKLIRGDLEWKYFCPTHEYIRCMNGTGNNQNIDAITITEHYDGGSRDNKFKRDIELLLNEIEINPSDPDICRYYFYLGRSYEDLHDYKNAAKYYKQRSEIPGFDEEIYYALYKYGICNIMMNKSFNKICESLLNAYYFRPYRLEALHHLVTYCLNNKYYTTGYSFGKLVYDNTTSLKEYPSNDVLFIDKNIHTYLFYLNFSLCAHYSGQYNDALDCSFKLLNNNINNNIKYILVKNIFHNLIKYKNYVFDIENFCDIIMELYKSSNYSSKYYDEILVFCNNNYIYNICYTVGKKMLSENLDEKINEYDIMSIKDAVSVAAYYVGNYEESINLCNELLTYNFDDNYRNRILANIEFSKQKLLN